MRAEDPRRGILLMVATTLVFAIQDGMSRHLAATYNVLMVVMIRYWFLAAFVVLRAARERGGLGRVAGTRWPWLQALRGVLLAAEICVALLAFVLLGLIDTAAIFIVHPLLVAALSGPVLGERVGWRRWAAIAAGFAGVLVILDPTAGALRPAAAVPLLSAAMFALYALLTRYVARTDTTATSFFWTGTTGAVFMTLAGVWFWEPMAPADWGWMAALCLTGAAGHWMMIRAYELAEASVVQPFSYFHLVFVAAIGTVVFGEEIRLHVAAGAAIVVGAGLFTLWREGLRRAGGT